MQAFYFLKELIMRNMFLSLMTIIFAVTLSSHAESGNKLSLLVKNGKTSFTIYHERTAASTAKDAAKELQTYIKKVTGANIQISTKVPREPYISLGENKLSAKAGLNLSKVKADGYIISIKNW